MWMRYKMKTLVSEDSCMDGLFPSVFVCLIGPENEIAGVVSEEVTAQAWVDRGNIDDPVSFRHYQERALGLVSDPLHA